MSQAEVFALLRQVGVDDRNARILTPIAKRESGGRYWINNAGLNSNGTVDHGLFQINDIWANDPDIRKIGWGRRYDPVANAQMAKVVLRKQGLKAWATYTSADDRYIGKGAEGYQGPETGGRGPSTRVTRTTEVPAGSRKALLLNYLQERGKPDALLSLATGLKAAEQTTTTRTRAPGRSNGQPNGSGSAPASAPGGLLEMYHDPGINIDNGSPTGPIGGHGSHVHVALDNPQAMLRVARLAKNMGLALRENPKWDPPDPGVHTQGSFHYQRFPGRRLGKAVDVSGGTPQALLAFNRRVARMFK